MKFYALAHLENHVLRRDLFTVVGREHNAIAVSVAHIAEFDDRRLYLTEGYPSMYQYCVGMPGLSEDAAAKRIHAARAARKFPAVFEMLADGRLSLSAAVLLAPHLASETAEGLLEAAAKKSCESIRLLIAERFPRPDLPELVRPVAPVVSPAQHATQHVHGLSDCPSAPATPRPEEPSAPRPNVRPLAPERFAMQLTISQDTHDKLRYAQALLGHVLPSGDLAQVLDRALDALIAKLEQRKFAAAAQSRPAARRGKGNERHIPAAVRRTIWQRDGGRCTFVSDKGHRCEARKFLEFDHADPVARGGQTTAANLRLRCRAHNQYAAECAYGVGFMHHKRREARRRAALTLEATRAREGESA